MSATTSNMITVILSTRNPSSMEKEPMSNQVNDASCLKAGSLPKSMATNMAMDKIKVMVMAPTETQSPCRGRRFPKKIWITNATNGRKRINNE